MRADVIPQLADADEVLARHRPARRRLGLRADPERARAGERAALSPSASRRSTSSSRPPRPTTARTSTARSTSRSPASSACSAAPATRGCAARRVISTSPSAAPTRATSRPSACSTSPAGWPRAGAQEIGFGDTTGMANPRAGARVLRAGARESLAATSSSPRTSTTRAARAWPTCWPRSRPACDSFESSFGELGGCPVPPGATGNIATEDLVSMLHEMGDRDRHRPRGAAGRRARRARRPRPPAGQPHAGRRSRRLAGGLMSRIDELLEQARARLTRVDPAAARAAIDAGAVLVDIRAESQRARDGVVPGSVFIARNVLEWRCDPERIAPRRARGRSRAPADRHVRRGLSSRASPRRRCRSSATTARPTSTAAFRPGAPPACRSSRSSRRRCAERGASSRVAASDHHLQRHRWRPSATCTTCWRPTGRPSCAGTTRSGWPSSRRSAPRAARAWRRSLGDPPAARPE